MSVVTLAKACVHHWLVRPPEGATSWANCRKCGKRKRFSNSFEWHDRANNSDIFVDNPVGWRPSWRSPVTADPSGQERLGAARMAGLSRS